MSTTHESKEQRSQEKLHPGKGTINIAASHINIWRRAAPSFKAKIG